MLNEEMRAVVHGSVQGVGFRATTKEYADRLCLKGYVRNVSNGTVEICAQGDRKRLEELIELLKSTFGPEHIQRIDVSFKAKENSYTHFFIARLL